jgi:8-oxo-dGTP pyrophosphatase MutT (NUDIX family)
VPLDAATVVLLRDGVTGPEAYLFRRASDMAFAPGMTAFPGGGVDGSDALPVPWVGPDATWWATRFGCTPELAGALVCAAVRETFEEAGVLLAGPADGGVVTDVSPYASVRKALITRELALGGFLASAGLVLRADLLRPWANWITPEPRPRRYDTRFFLAALPPGQTADTSAITEAAEASWQTPSAALADLTTGTRIMLPPTYVTLTELTGFDSVAAALAHDREVLMMPPPRSTKDGA